VLFVEVSAGAASDDLGMLASVVSRAGVGEVERDDEPAVLAGRGVDEVFVGQLKDLRAGGVQPGVASTQADEVLVEAIDRPAVGG
jgi:hypothetical protein